MKMLRRLMLLYGLLVFAWLSPEDNLVWPPVVLGLGLVLLLVIRWVMKTLRGRALAPREILLGAPLFGLLIGLGTSISAAGLMFFKNALHAHIFLDFPPLLMLAILERAPAWGLAGALAGLGLAFGWLVLHNLDHEQTHNSHL
ncbi:MAG: hypothetical protein K8L97_16410 [Anaerolineae bacterium]|nr:hypothetical protein [Anaerolineae bacterium]